jgi:hypothetical protein
MNYFYALCQPKHAPTSLCDGIETRFGITATSDAPFSNGPLLAPSFTPCWQHVLCSFYLAITRKVAHKYALQRFESLKHHNFETN